MGSRWELRDTRREPIDAYRARRVAEDAAAERARVEDLVRRAWAALQAPLQVAFRIAYELKVRGIL